MIGYLLRMKERDTPRFLRLPLALQTDPARLGLRARETKRLA